MLQATAYINFLIPIGAFVMDPALEVISFKRTVSCKVDALKEDIANMIGYEIFESLRLVELFVAPLCLKKRQYYEQYYLVVIPAQCMFGLTESDGVRFPLYFCS